MQGGALDYSIRKAAQLQICVRRRLEESPRFGEVPIMMLMSFAVLL